MQRVQSKEVILLEKWMGFPSGTEHNLIKTKADDLIKRGVAEAATKSKTKQQGGVKNRAITEAKTK